MDIAREDIANKLEELAAAIRSGKLKPINAQVRYELQFQSRPLEDGHRMQGRQGFSTKEKAAKFMHDGLSVFQKFDGARGILTVTYDQTEEVQQEMQALGPVEVPAWVRKTHPDFSLPSFVSAAAPVATTGQE